MRSVAVRMDGVGTDWLPRDEGPVTVVFGTSGYRKTVLRWIAHARRAGCRHYRIVCLDGALLGALGAAGESERAVALAELLPDTPVPDLEAMGAAERLKRLTPLRAAVFRRLAAAGCDFIHSDADAVWLGDVRPWLMRRGAWDLLLSQGTTFPRAHHDRHRLVVCAGFFLCRANARTVRYFAEVEALVASYRSDQASMNAVLLRDRGWRWRVESPTVAVWWRGRWRRPRRAGWIGAWVRLALACPAVRVPLNLASRAARLDYIVTSREIMGGRSGGGLTAGVIPMHLVMRGRFAPGGDPLVFHSSVNKVG